MAQKWQVFFLIACLLACVGAAWGQGNVATLNGTVLDSAGAVVPGASVVVVNNDTKVENRTTTTSAGAYTLPYLPQGTYTIRVTAAGFRTSTAENVILRAAQILTVNISLEIGQVNEQITVSATPPVLEAGAWLISRAWRPMWESPISPSISARGVNAATESITIRSTALDRTSVSAISSACSPVSGCEMSMSSRLTPIFWA